MKYTDPDGYQVNSGAWDGSVVHEGYVMKYWEISGYEHSKRNQGPKFTDWALSHSNWSNKLLIWAYQSALKHEFQRHERDLKNDNPVKKDHNRNTINYNSNGVYSEPNRYGYDMYLSPDASKKYIRAVSDGLTIKSWGEGVLGLLSGHFFGTSATVFLFLEGTLTNANSLLWNIIMYDYDGSGLKIEYRNYNIGNTQSGGIMTIYRQSDGKELGSISF